MRAATLITFIVLFLGATAYAQTPADSNCPVKGLVTIHARHIDIQAALRQVAQQARLNIAVPPTLHRKISIDATCEHAHVVLRQLLQQFDGGYCMEGNVIRVFRKTTKCSARQVPPYIPLSQ